MYTGSRIKGVELSQLVEVECLHVCLQKCTSSSSDMFRDHIDSNMIIGDTIL